MKRCFLFLAVLGLFFSSSVFAQVAKIVAVSGDVLVKKDKAFTWEKAKLEMLLEKEAEIKTGKFSECTIAFDEELNNMLTIKENSRIRLQELKPVEVFLPKGRVFSLIDDLASLHEFKVRTPTAVAGVRGTGDSVDSRTDGTTVKCYKGSVDVEGLDSNGRQKNKTSISGGSGIDVGLDGSLGNPFGLSGRDWDEWDDFLDGVKDTRKDREPEEALGSGGSDVLDDFQDERRDDFRDDIFEDLRRDQEDMDMMDDYKDDSGDDDPGDDDSGSDRRDNDPYR